jgi:hypothetical protein
MEFTTQGPMVFQSTDHFYDIKTNLQNPETYFCNKGAYAICNPFQTTELAKNYWNSLEGGAWEKFVSDWKVPFLACWQFFLSGKKPPLAAYFLMANLFYTNIVAALE